jgi:hypothetical protein
MFVGSITALAGKTLAAAAYGIAFFTLSGVDHFVFSEATKGTEHGCILLQLVNRKLVMASVGDACGVI